MARPGGIRGQSVNSENKQKTGGRRWSNKYEAYEKALYFIFTEALAFPLSLTQTTFGGDDGE